MTQVTVIISGASRGATLTWNAKSVALTDMGNGTFTGAVQSNPGTFIYAIVVFGSPGDAWTATASDGTTTNNHSGHMSPAGFDTTGDTAFAVH